MRKQFRVNKKKVSFLVLGIIALFGISMSSAQATPGNFPSKGNGTYYNVKWRTPTNCSPWHYMAGEPLFDLPGRCDKSGPKLGVVRVLDFTTSHFPVYDAVATINQYLASNSNMFRLEYASPYQANTNCSGHEPCISIQETSGAMAVLGQTFTTGSFCSLKTNPSITMSWPNMYQYSITARKGAIIHEIYHAFGLSHSQYTNDIMYGSAGEPSAPTAGIARATPSANDSVSISNLYGRWGTSALVYC